MVTVLYVCEHNYNRSPAAEAIMSQATYGKSMFAGVEAASAGLSQSHYTGILPEMRYALTMLGYRAVTHTVRVLTDELIGRLEPDIVLCMESSHVERVIESFPQLEGISHGLAAYAEGSEEDITITGLIGEVPQYRRIEKLPYFLRKRFYKHYGSVDRRDMEAIADVHYMVARRIEELVYLVLGNMIKHKLI